MIIRRVAAVALSAHENEYACLSFAQSAAAATRVMITRDLVFVIFFFSYDEKRRKANAISENGNIRTIPYRFRYLCVSAVAGVSG